MFPTACCNGTSAWRAFIPHTVFLIKTLENEHMEWIDGTFKLLDGDKIAGLSAMYIIDLVKAAGIDSISVGVVQTAYANGASTQYLRNTLVRGPYFSFPTSLFWSSCSAFKYLTLRDIDNER